jgi:phage terminase small subunit
MAPLPNPRHEAFCRALATGKSQGEAYVAAGYRRDDGHAARLAGNGKIKARVKELLGKAAQRILVTIDTIAKQLDEDRQLAYEQGQASAAVSASMSKAKLYGLVTDRHEIEGSLRKPLREPLGPSEQKRSMTMDEWVAKFAPASLGSADEGQPDSGE